MFFYLSFLRTPPHSSPQSSPVVFTPQVSNDLRTEPFPASVDIFYWWSTCTPQSVTRLSEPTKLTTWRQENAYKPVQIPPPPKNVVGATGIDCSLVFSPAPSVASSVIDLRDPEIGRAPLPVCTLPIRISPKRDGHAGGAATAKAAKQEAITRTFRLFDGDASPLMRIKETISFDLDKKLWDSGIGLSAWLVRLSRVTDVDVSAVASESSPPGLVQELKDRLFGRDDCHIIELGAGTGIVSLVLAALRSAKPTSESASTSNHGTSILSTDLPSSMELMSYNILSNTALFPHCPPTALPLDWDDELPETVHNNVREHGGYGVVAMADVTYNTSSFPALLRTLAALLVLSTRDSHDSDIAEPDAHPDPDDPGVLQGHDHEEERQHGEPLVLLAYKERDPAERQLWDMMARETGVVLECVGKQPGAGGFPVEIWLGRKRQCGGKKVT